jgi:hypothetical protein
MEVIAQLLAQPWDRRFERHPLLGTQGGGSQQLLRGGHPGIVTVPAARRKPSRSMPSTSLPEV